MVLLLLLNQNTAILRNDAAYQKRCDEFITKYCPNTESQYRKILKNKFHSCQTQVKTTGKIDIYIFEKKRIEIV